MRTTKLLQEMADEFPGFRLVRKDQSPLSHAIHVCLVTLGAKRSYLTDFHTTIGRTVYVASDWDQISDEQRAIALRHERVHLRQFRRFSLPGMALLYLFVPVPFGLALFRARFEKEAYEETLRAMAEIHGPACLENPQLRRHVVDQFVSGSYGWMWPFRRSVEAWFDRTAAAVQVHAAR